MRRLLICVCVTALGAGIVGAASVAGSPTASASKLTKAKCKKLHGKARKKCFKKLHQQQGTSPTQPNTPVYGCSTTAKCTPTINFRCNDCTDPQDPIYTGLHHTPAGDVQLGGNLLINGADAPSQPVGTPLTASCGGGSPDFIVRTEGNGNFHFTCTANPAGIHSIHGAGYNIKFEGDALNTSKSEHLSVWIDHD